MVSSISKTDQGLAITGELVFANVTELSDQGNQIIIDANQQDEFEIDCSEMERIDSAGIALLLQWQRETSKNNRACRFVALRDQSKSLIQAYKLESIIAT